MIWWLNNNNLLNQPCKERIHEWQEGLKTMLYEAAGWPSHFYWHQGCPQLIFHLWFIVTTDQLSQDKAVRERWLRGPGVRAHRRLLLHPRPLPAQWAPLPPRAGGLVGPLRDAQLPGAAVPAAAGGLQALPRLGGCGCPSGLSETGHRFVLGCAFLRIHIEMHYIDKSCYGHMSNSCSS